MGIFGGIIAGAAQGAGEAGVAVGKQMMVEDAATRLKQMEAEIAQARDTRLRDWRNTDTVAGEERAIENAPRMQAATLPGEKAKAEMASGVAVEQRRQTAKIESDQEIAKKKELAPFEREQKQLDALAVAETAKTLAADPAYLNAQKALTAASETSATRASAADHMMNIAVNRVKLDQQKNIARARSEYEIAVKGDDQSVISKAKSALDATMYDNNADKANLTATASVIRTLESSVNTLEARKGSATTPADQERIQREIDTTSRELESFVADYKKRTGIKTQAKEKPNPTAVDWADARKRRGDVKFVAAFADHFGADAAAQINAPGPQSDKSIIGSGEIPAPPPQQLPDGKENPTWRNWNEQYGSAWSKQEGKRKEDVKRQQSDFLTRRAQF